jgi:hypothetical protein
MRAYHHRMGAEKRVTVVLNSEYFKIIRQITNKFDRK